MTVLTTRAPQRRESDNSARVRRWPVLRDKDGYVRGYLKYLSFDLPLFFRLLFSRRADVIVAEPPPTTTTVVRVVSFLRRIPYVYYAADVWSDAATATTAPGWLLRLLRQFEVGALRSAAVVLSVSEAMTVRLSELGVHHVATVGNGVDVSALTAQNGESEIDVPYFVYPGTASEVHGARIFLEAFARVIPDEPRARLLFIGHGAQVDEMKSAAAALPNGSVEFRPRTDLAELGRMISNATAALASVRPGQGYDFAFPTKLYAAVAAGAPVIFSGAGPARTFVAEADAGEAVDYSVDDVASAMRRALADQPTPGRRDRLRAWAREHVDLAAVAQRAARAIESVAVARGGVTP